jgi:CBS domain-containing protein
MVVERLPLLPVVHAGSLVGVLTRDAIMRIVEGQRPVAAAR